MVSSTILYHLQRTSNICLYQIGNGKLAVPASLFFPMARTVTLIHCTPEGVSGILQPSIFPNLDQVHYLSAHPGSFDIHKRFRKPITWLFPNYQYDFYRCMIEAGFGKVENRLIRTYIHKFTEYSNGFQVDINLPGIGYTDGMWYKQQIQNYFSQKKLHTCLVQTVPDEYSYLYTPNPYVFDEPDPYFECGSPQDSIHAYVQQNMEADFFKHIMKDVKK